MPLFVCSKCGCVENTALANYWTRGRDENFEKITPEPPPLCSQCDPKISAWHGAFDRKHWRDYEAEHGERMKEQRYGFLNRPEDSETPHKTGLALSIQQPWAWLIVRPDITDPAERLRAYAERRIKDVENRTWSTRVRGIVGIHAGKTIDWDAVEDIRDIAPEIQLPDTFQTGGIIGRAEFADCVSEMDSRWFFGPYGFVLRNAEPLPFMPCRGKLGFFRPEIRHD